MSLSSASSFSVAGSGIKQQGTLTFVAGQTCTVPVPSISATDVVLTQIRTQTARTNPDLGLDGIFTIAVTAGTGFTAVSLDVLFAGTVAYAVYANGLPDVNITSA
jgi:hypothetical protein